MSKMKREEKPSKVVKDEIKEIKEKSKGFLDDRRKANFLLEIFSSSETEEEDVILACIHAFHKIYTAVIINSEMFLDKSLQAEDVKDLTKEDKFKVWLKERYDETRNKLLELLLHTNENIRELSLCTLMKFVKAEGQNPLVKISDKSIWFPSTFFQKIICSLVNTEIDLSSLIGRFQEFLEFDDVRYYCMKTTNHLVKEQKSQENIDIFLTNTFAMLENLSMPASAPEDDRLTNFLTRVPDVAGLKVNTYKEHKKLFSTLWLEFLKLKLPIGLYKKVLVMLHDKVIPYMTNPRLLTDFLTYSYNIGGAVSLLALNGVFVLVNQYNLDYPDFYQKLYALFEPSVFHVKYSARFFYLADLFLSSTHLPSYLIAAFIKRLSRLSLTAPPSGLTVILPFVYNLLRRHPNCEVLTNNPDAPADIKSDPYLMEETDPAKCKAMKSSLWEIKTLQEHYHHSISKEAKAVDQRLSRDETDVSSLLETTIDDMIDAEKKKKLKTVACTFDPPSGLFATKEDILGQFWTWKDY